MVASPLKVLEPPLNNIPRALAYLPRGLRVHKTGTLAYQTEGLVTNTFFFVSSRLRLTMKSDDRNVSSTLKARFYGHRFSGKARFSGQNCYDGTTVFSNSGNFNIAENFGTIFALKVFVMSSTF